MYPVQVTCRKCPIEPWYWATEKRVPEKTFEIAAIERRLAGKRIETKEDEGWRWAELDTIDEKAGGATRAHRDALKLLMVLIQNSDTKPPNQRIMCAPDAVKKDAAGNETCARPFLYVQDLGYAFGEATLLGRDVREIAPRGRRRGRSGTPGRHPGREHDRDQSRPSKRCLHATASCFHHDVRGARAWRETRL
jgi:hypothetical protein